MQNLQLDIPRIQETLTAIKGSKTLSVFEQCCIQKINSDLVYHFPPETKLQSEETKSHLLSFNCGASKFRNYEHEIETYSAIQQFLIGKLPKYGCLQDIGGYDRIIRMLNFFGYHVYFAPTMFNGNYCSGNLIFSYVPASNINLIIDPWCFPLDRKTGESMTLVDLYYPTIHAEFVDFDLFNIYSSSFTSPVNRERSIRKVFTEHTDIGVDAILVGDFNSHGINTTPHRFFSETLCFAPMAASLWFRELWRSITGKDSFNQNPVNTASHEASSQIEEIGRQFEFKRVGLEPSYTLPLHKILPKLFNGPLEKFDMNVSFELDFALTNIEDMRADYISDPIGLQDHSAIVLNKK